MSSRLPNRVTADSTTGMLQGPSRPLSRNAEAAEAVAMGRAADPLVPFMHDVENVVVVGRLEIGQVSNLPDQPLIRGNRLRASPTGLVDPLADEPVPDPHSFQDRVPDEPLDRHRRPLLAAAAGASRDPQIVKPVGDFGEGRSILQPAEGFLDQFLGLRILPQLGVGLGFLPAQVAPEWPGQGASVQEAVLLAPLDAEGRITVVLLVAKRREVGAQPPAFLGHVDVVVDGNQPCFGVLAHLTDRQGMGAPTDAAQVLRNHDVPVAALDQVFQLTQLGPIQILAAILTLDDMDFDRPASQFLQTLTAVGNLVLQTSLVLFLGRDPGDDDHPHSIGVLPGRRLLVVLSHRLRFLSEADRMAQCAKLDDYS